jgi:putative tryptophan/tyrosine transport system substrate-binding protein
MSKSFFGFALSALLLALSVPADAHQSGKIPRIGYVSSLGSPNNPGPLGEAFRQGLRDLGYIDGKNILIEARYLEGRLDRIPSLVTELVQLKIDVLVSTTSPAIRAAKQATQTIPIVMIITEDPVATGLVKSLARPGGNITGLTRMTRELSGKRLELLKEGVPTVLRVGILTGMGRTGVPTAFQEYDAAARTLKLRVKLLEVHGTNPDFQGTFREAIKSQLGALIAVRNGIILPHQKRIADLAIRNRLPSMHEGADFVEAGGLMSYATNEAESYRRAATYVDKILKGAKPAELPVEQPTRFEFVINLKTAKQIGLTIPPNVLVRADRVIK